MALQKGVALHGSSGVSIERSPSVLVRALHELPKGGPSLRVDCFVTAKVKSAYAELKIENGKFFAEP